MPSSRGAVSCGPWGCGTSFWPRDCHFDQLTTSFAQIPPGLDACRDKPCALCSQHQLALVKPKKGDKVLHKTGPHSLRKPHRIRSHVIRILRVVILVDDRSSCIDSVLYHTYTFLQRWYWRFDKCEFYLCWWEVTILLLSSRGQWFINQLN